MSKRETWFTKDSSDNTSSADLIQNKHNDLSVVRSDRKTINTADHSLLLAAAVSSVGLRMQVAPQTLTMEVVTLVLTLLA